MWTVRWCGCRVCIRHEDGSVRFWDVSSAGIRLLYKLTTADMFGGYYRGDMSDIDADEEWPPFRKVSWLTDCVCLDQLLFNPFPSNRHHWSNGDCPEGKRENCQVCSVQYCVQQLYTVNCTHIWTDLAVVWIGFCLTGTISLYVDSFLCLYYFVYHCISHACCSIVTWWGGPGGIEAWSLGHYFLRCFDTVGWVILPVKTCPQYDI